MAAAADCRIEVLLAPKLHRRDHVRHVGTLGNHARAFVDHGVVDRAGTVVVGVFRPNQPSAKNLRQLFKRGIVKHGILL
jgi:hypothetical protein